MKEKLSITRKDLTLPFLFLFLPFTIKSRRLLNSKSFCQSRCVLFYYSYKKYEAFQAEGIASGKAYWCVMAKHLRELYKI